MALVPLQVPKLVTAVTFPPAHIDDDGCKENDTSDGGPFTVIVCAGVVKVPQVFIIDKEIE